MNKIETNPLIAHDDRGELKLYLNKNWQQVLSGSIIEVDEKMYHVLKNISITTYLKEKRVIPKETKLVLLAGINDDTKKFEIIYKEESNVKVNSFSEERRGWYTEDNYRMLGRIEIDKTDSYIDGVLYGQLEIVAIIANTKPIIKKIQVYEFYLNCRRGHSNTRFITAREMIKEVVEDKEKNGMSYLSNKSNQYNNEFTRIQVWSCGWNIWVHPYENLRFDLDDLIDLSIYADFDLYAIEYKTGFVRCARFPSIL